jgi:DNA primase
MFPIKNLSGQVIAFGGRIIGGEDAAKYINSAESPLYKKGDQLYGLYQARRGITAQRSVMLTEGYMDVLSLHQFGYVNACAALGTALTEEQIRRLAGFCSRFELIFDADSAGAKAALRACTMLLARGLSCSVVMLPEGEDIDSLLQKSGTQAFEEARSYARDGLDFCIRALSSVAPREALAWVKDFLSAVELPEILPRYISRLSQGLDLDERFLREHSQVKRKKTRQAFSARRASAPDPAEGGHEGAPLGAAMRDDFSENAQPDEGDPALSRGAPFARPAAMAEGGSAFLPGAGRGDCGERTPRFAGPESAIMKFLVRCPHYLPILRDAGARLTFTQSWARSLWEKWNPARRSLQLIQFCVCLTIRKKNSGAVTGLWRLRLTDTKRKNWPTFAP